MWCSALTHGCWGQAWRHQWRSAPGGHPHLAVLASLQPSLSPATFSLWSPDMDTAHPRPCATLLASRLPTPSATSQPQSPCTCKGSPLLTQLQTSSGLGYPGGPSALQWAGTTAPPEVLSPGLGDVGPLPSACLGRSPTARGPLQHSLYIFTVRPPRVHHSFH